jgi:hypothetical protein
MNLNETIKKENKRSLTKNMPSPTSSPISLPPHRHDRLPDRCPIYQRTQNAIPTATSPYLPGPAVAHTF